MRSHSEPLGVRTSADIHGHHNSALPFLLALLGLAFASATSLSQNKNVIPSFLTVRLRYSFSTCFFHIEHSGTASPQAVPLPAWSSGASGSWGCVPDDTAEPAVVTGTDVFWKDFLHDGCCKTSIKLKWSQNGLFYINFRIHLGWDNYFYFNTYWHSLWKIHIFFVCVSRNLV